VSNLLRFSNLLRNTEVLVAMKPDPLDSTVVNHRMDDCHAVQQRTNYCSKDHAETTNDKHSSSSPINSDVIFETWDMVSVCSVLLLVHS